MEIKFSYTLSKSGDELLYARKGECPRGVDMSINATCLVP